MIHDYPRVSVALVLSLVAVDEPVWDVHDRNSHVFFFFVTVMRTKNIRRFGTENPRVWVCGCEEI